MINFRGLAASIKQTSKGKWPQVSIELWHEKALLRVRKKGEKRVFHWFNIVLIAIGIYVAVDGVASVLVKHGQYHNVWFDGERYVRALAGIVIIILGIAVT